MISHAIGCGIPRVASLTSGLSLPITPFAVRLWGWSENSLELERAKTDEKPYGTDPSKSSLDAHLQSVAHRNSAFSQLKFSESFHCRASGSRMGQKARARALIKLAQCSSQARFRGSMSSRIPFTATVHRKNQSKIGFTSCNLHHSNGISAKLSRLVIRPSFHLKRRIASRAPR